eukprot:6275612-Alexandrium_andersonii.AAC.1
MASLTGLAVAVGELHLHVVHDPCAIVDHVQIQIALKGHCPEHTESRIDCRRNCQRRAVHPKEG